MVRQSRPPLPDRERPGRPWGRWVRRALLSLVVVAAGVFAFPQIHPAGLGYHPGDIARERVVAPFDFHVQKDEAALAHERELAGLAVPPVAVHDPRVWVDVEGRLTSFDEGVNAATARASEAPEREAQLRQLGVSLPPDAFRALAAAGRAPRILDSAHAILADLFARGIVADRHAPLFTGATVLSVRTPAGEQPTALDSLWDLRECDARARGTAEATFAGDAAGAAATVAVVDAFVRPNVIYDAIETDWRRTQARAAVVPDVGEVQKNELIVDAGERITPAVLERLRSLEALQAAARGPADFVTPSLARIMLLLLFVATFAIYLRFEQPHVYQDNGLLLLCALLASATFGMAAVFTNVLHLPEYAVPFAFAPLILSILFDKRLALVFTLLLVVALSAVAEYRPTFVPVAAVGGIVAVYAVRRLRQRRHFYAALLTMALAVTLAIAALGFGQQAPVRSVLRDILAGIIGSGASSALAMLLLPIVEASFRIPSDITLLELSDLNRPLLRRLMMEAPGTYHHSLLVGSLAESAAEAIGANSLRARVCAYHHDIGKLAKPEYYTENEQGAVSRHARLAPSMSALVIKAHVTEGLELAKKEKLPPAVSAAIPEHHGTTVMAFFYAKALEQDPTTPDHDYRYPGPRPQSKETAIVMLADSIEGASRSLTQPTPARLRGLVNKIVDQRLHEGQLDECGLSLADVARIREAFLQVLTGIFHVRVAYPELPGRPRDVDFAREPRPRP
jgi:putative nucleotidyltransferase with HDIG domain